MKLEYLLSWGVCSCAEGWRVRALCVSRAGKSVECAGIACALMRARYTKTTPCLVASSHIIFEQTKDPRTVKYEGLS